MAATERDLLDDERELLAFLLERPFEGQEQLVAQAKTARYGGSSCGCGCPSFYVAVDRSLPAANADYTPVEAGAYGRDPGGNAVGVILFVKDGYLHNVEVYSNEEHSHFAGIPKPAALQHDVVEPE